MNPIPHKTPRIEVVDALRGFAVVAICLVHSIEHFIFPVYPTNSPAWLTFLDDATFNVVFSLFAGKAYAIFALLFGFTFYIQQNNQKLKGKDFGYRYLWRLLLLTGFATLNAAFFPAGDVLLLFSVTGISLFVVRKWSNRAVLITAIICLLQPIEAYHLLRYLLDANYTMTDLQIGAMYKVIEENTKSGDFINFIGQNITLGQKASFLWAVNAGRFIQTVGLFLLGYLIARKGLFIKTDKNNRFWIKALIVGAISFAPLFALKEMVSNNEHIILTKTLGTSLDMWQKLAFTFVLVSSFILLYSSHWFKTKCKYLAIYGKMSLTNYISQSILGAIIYFPFGFYLAPYTGYFLSLLVGVGIVIIQIIFCRWWFNSHRQGPLEALWHKFTWIKSKN